MVKKEKKLPNFKHFNKSISARGVQRETNYGLRSKDQAIQNAAEMNLENGATLPESDENFERHGVVSLHKCDNCKRTFTSLESYTQHCLAYGNARASNADPAAVDHELRESNEIGEDANMHSEILGGSSEDTTDDDSDESTDKDSDDDTSVTSSGHSFRHLIPAKKPIDSDSALSENEL